MLIREVKKESLWSFRFSSNVITCKNKGKALVHKKQNVVLDSFPHFSTIAVHKYYVYAKTCKVG